MLLVEFEARLRGSSRGGILVVHTPGSESPLRQEASPERGEIDPRLGPIAIRAGQEVVIEVGPSEDGAGDLRYRLVLRTP